MKRANLKLMGVLIVVVMLVVVSLLFTRLTTRHDLTPLGMLLTSLALAVQFLGGAWLGYQLRRAKDEKSTTNKS
jgi:hypothetical protein